MVIALTLGPVRVMTSNGEPDVVGQQGDKPGNYPETVSFGSSSDLKRSSTLS